MSADPWQFWTAERIAAASGCALSDVQAYWPKIVDQLALCGIADRPVQVAVIGTATVESGMRPIHEYGTEADWAGYEGGAAYAGRGFVQTTHRSGYAAAGKSIAALWGADPNDPAFDLVAHPDNLLNPDMAAAALAIFFRDKATIQGYTLVQAAREGNYDWIRRLVLGGPDPKGTARLTAIAAALGASPVIDTALTYNASQPPERQVQDWACSIRTLTWMLKSMGVQIEAGDLQDEMVPDVVTPAVGLLDGRGNGLAAIMRRHVPESVGVTVTWASDWETLTSLAGTGPIGIGSGSLYHWLAVAALIDANTVKTANPAPNYPPGGALGDTLTRDQFNQYAPWAMVMGTIGAAQPAPVPTPAAWTVPSGVFAGLTGPQLQEKAEGLVSAVAYQSDTVGDAMTALVKELQRVRTEQVGARP